jgi:hypothetical protein
MMTKQINIDLNRVTRRQMVEYRKARSKLTDGLDIFDFENLSQHVITGWPYGEVTLENYLDLGLEDAAAVDRAVSDALEDLGKKK